MNTTENQNDHYAQLQPEYLRSLCGGHEPHCVDWTREMLPDGYRPLAAGEEIQNGVDEIYYEGATPKWYKCSNPEGTSAMPTMQHRRTKRPFEYRIAPDPAPAGKLTDEQLGEIGAKAAFEAGNKVGWLMCVHDGKPGNMIGYSAWRGDTPARAAFAAAVREAVEKEHRLTPDQNSRMFAVECQNTAYKTESAKQAEKIARLTAELEQAHVKAVEMIKLNAKHYAELERLREKDERCEFENAHMGESLADKESNWRTWKLAKKQFTNPNA